VGEVGLGHDHESGRVPVQAVDDPRTSFRPSGEGGAPGDQGVYQSIVPVTGSGVNHQAGRLVDDGEVFVFVDEGEWNGGGTDGARWLTFREPHLDPLTPGE
jgi:hypothetical protein